MKMKYTFSLRILSIWADPSEPKAVKNDYPEVMGTFEKELRYWTKRYSTHKDPKNLCRN